MKICTKLLKFHFAFTKMEHHFSMDVRWKERKWLKIVFSKFKKLIIIGIMDKISVLVERLAIPWNLIQIPDMTCSFVTHLYLTCKQWYKSLRFNGKVNETSPISSINLKSLEVIAINVPFASNKQSKTHVNMPHQRQFDEHTPVISSVTQMYTRFTHMFTSFEWQSTSKRNIYSI